MRVCLIMPVAKFYSADSQSVPPYAILYLGSALKRAGHDVKIVHQVEGVVESAIDFNPDIVGISAFTGYPVSLACDYARQIKSISPSIKIVLGGYHASVLPEQVMNDLWFDFAVVGEGEETIVELADSLGDESKYGGIKGLLWRSSIDGKVNNNGVRPFNDNIDFDIDWSLIDVGKYTRGVSHLGGKRYFYIFSSRGCPFSCSFCSASFLYKGCYRKESSDHVIKQYKKLIDDNNVDLVEYLDDNFFVDVEWAKRVVLGIGKPYRALIRVDRINEETCKLLNDTGCRAIFVGIESGNERIRNDVMNKRLRDRQIYDAVSMMSRMCPDINISAMFIGGIPGETYSDYRDTCDMAVNLSLMNRRLLPQFNVYAPYPYCKSYVDAVNGGWVPPSRTDDWVLDSKPGKSINVVWLKHYSKSLMNKFKWTAVLFLLLRKENDLRGFKRIVKEILRNVAIFRLRFDFFWLPLELHLFWTYYLRMLKYDVVK